MAGRIRDVAIKEHAACGKEQGDKSGMRGMRCVGMNEACSVRQKGIDNVNQSVA